MRHLLPIALCSLTACTTTSPDAPLSNRLCERASSAAADAQTILETLAAMGYAGGKAEAVLALIRQGRLVLTATCAIVSR